MSVALGRRRHSDAARMGVSSSFSDSGSGAPDPLARLADFNLLGGFFTRELLGHARLALHHLHLRLLRLDVDLGQRGLGLLRLLLDLLRARQVPLPRLVRDAFVDDFLLLDALLLKRALFLADLPRGLGLLRDALRVAVLDLLLLGLDLLARVRLFFSCFATRSASIFWTWRRCSWSFAMFCSPWTMRSISLAWPAETRLPSEGRASSS